MIKHTPGPWEHIGSIRAVGEDGDETDLYCGSVVPEPWRGSVCSIQSADHIDGICREEAEANARLIAAAPELYALAERIARLNKDAGEIGAGMLASLVDEANRIIGKVE